MINTSRYIMKDFEVGEIYPGYFGDDGILAKIIFLAADHFNALVIKVDPIEALRYAIAEDSLSRFDNAEKMRFTIKGNPRRRKDKVGVCPGGELFSRKMRVE
mgnify:CR=1 FL=1